MSKIYELQTTTIGKSIAEDEIEGLKHYFCKTELWDEIICNDVDIIFGCKGSGKSAIYNYLSSNGYELFDKNVILASAENPRGTAAFNDLNIDPPSGENEIKSIWKLYFVMVITQQLQEHGYKDHAYNEVMEKLQESNLMPRTNTLASLLKMVRDYVRKLKPSLEGRVNLSEATGLIESFGVKISLGEPSVRLADKGVVSVDHLINLLNKSLTNNKNAIWIAIDRLDIIFQDNPELEVNAIRSLFQVYNDFRSYSNIRLIIFLRDDIWSRVLEKGFRELSHITKKETITWDKYSLFKLLMVRFEKNEKLLKYLNIEIGDSEQKKLEFFKKIFPKRNANNTADFDFNTIVTKIQDGNKNASPRELIQLVSVAIKHEIKLLSNGIVNLDSLLSHEALTEGLKLASIEKFNTLIAEYPQLRTWIMRLKKKKVRLTIQELTLIWECKEKDAIILVKNLIKYGFFGNEADDENKYELYIPIIYRPALNLPH